MVMMNLRKKTRNVKKGREMRAMEITQVIPVIVPDVRVVLLVVPVNAVVVAVLLAVVCVEVIAQQAVKVYVEATVISIAKVVALFHVKQVLNTKSICDEKDIYRYSHDWIMV